MFLPDSAATDHGFPVGVMTWPAARPEHCPTKPLAGARRRIGKSIQCNADPRPFAA